MLRLSLNKVFWPLCKIGRIRLQCWVLFIFLVSLLTWVCFTVRLYATWPAQVEEQLPHSRIRLQEVDPDLTTVQTTSVVIRPALSLLLVLIHASGRGQARREAIRKTWLSTETLDHLKMADSIHVDYRFVLGVQNISESQRHNLTTEADYFQDMMLLESVTDEHKSLTNRTLQSFVHVSNNFMSDFHYVLKCDDDSFMNLVAIVHQLVQIEHRERIFWGEFLGSGLIFEYGPYAEKEWSICDSYLPYALGGGYVLSMDLVRLLASNAPYLKIYRNEDASVGAWLGPYNINRMSDTRFNTGAVSRGCKTPFIAMHKVDVKLMHKFHKAVQEEGRICTSSNQWYKLHGYLYNWKVLPRFCCRVTRRIP